MWSLPHRCKQPWLCLSLTALSLLWELPLPPSCNMDPVPSTKAACPGLSQLRSAHPCDACKLQPQRFPCSATGLYAGPHLSPDGEGSRAGLGGGGAGVQPVTQGRRTCGSSWLRPSAHPDGCTQSSVWFLSGLSRLALLSWSLSPVLSLILWPCRPSQPSQQRSQWQLPFPRLSMHQKQAWGGPQN